MQPCTECWILDGWVCNDNDNEKTSPHLGDNWNVHRDVQVSSLVSYKDVRSLKLIASLLCCICSVGNLWFVLVLGFRGDVVEIETWCQEEGRIGTRRDWILTDITTGSVIGKASRYDGS